MKILISAGESSGDRYAAELLAALRKRLPQAEFFGCGGPHLREQGLDAIVHSEELAVVGLVEVLAHIPRIHRLFQRLERSVRDQCPDLAILTDAPDFNLRLAARLQKLGIPIIYYVAPQVWAWRKWRVQKIKKLVDQLLVIFPFEEEFFIKHQVPATFVGHPLTDKLEQQVKRVDFFEQHGLDQSQPLVALLPGSRKGEAARHIPILQDAASRMVAANIRQFLMPVSNTTGMDFFQTHWQGPQTLLIEGATQDAIRHADVALVASGTATIETALLETPMATFYKMAWPSYFIAKLLVDVPFYSMVNLLAGKGIVKEFIQGECTGMKLAAETIRLLNEENSRCQMVKELKVIRAMLSTETPAAEQAATAICKQLQTIKD